MLGMKSYLPGEWKPGIILTEAIFNNGIEELADEIRRHKEFLISSGELERRRKERARLELMVAIEGSLKDYIYQRVDKGDYLEKLIDRLAHRKTNPYIAAQEIISRFSKQL